MHATALRHAGLVAAASADARQRPAAVRRAGSVARPAVMVTTRRQQQQAAGRSSGMAARASADGATSPASADGEGPVARVVGWIKAQQANAAALRVKVAALGLAAVLAYGFFDGISYTAAFTMAFLAYEKTTGLNPATNVKAVLTILLTMWAGNNVTRPFRVAGAAALAPWIDGVLKKAQARFGVPYVVAFAIAVASVAIPCLSVVGLLFLSRGGLKLAY